MSFETEVRKLIWDHRVDRRKYIFYSDKKLQTIDKPNEERLKLSKEVRKRRNRRHVSFMCKYFIGQKFGEKDPFADL